MAQHRNSLIVRQLGLAEYKSVWHQMQTFTDQRDDSVTDEIWVVEHQAVFTQGQAGKAEHILNNGDIPVVKVDRGGQVTYHGPGQLVLYLLLNLRRRNLGVRDLVTMMEESIVALLEQYHIHAYAKADAPGVYVNEKKIASLGLRVRKGCSFHGLALNIDMDLEPFLRINPCGYPGLEMVQSKQLNGPQSVTEAAEKLIDILAQALDAERVTTQVGLPKQLEDRVEQ